MLRRVTFQLGRCIRETGQALDRLGLKAIEKTSYNEQFSRHRQLMNIYDKVPNVSGDSWIAPNAAIIGEVQVGNEASVWYGAVLRGDLNPIVVGYRSNIQDQSVIHTSGDSTPGLPAGVLVGSYVTVGHGCTLYSCIIEDQCTIGMGSIILDGALIESNSILAAGTVVPPGRRIPSGQLWAGNPAKYVRDVTEEEMENFISQADKYYDNALTHRDEFLPYGTAYLDAERVKASGGKM